MSRHSSRRSSTTSPSRRARAARSATTSTSSRPPGSTPRWARGSRTSSPESSPRSSRPTSCRPSTRRRRRPARRSPSRSEGGGRTMAVTSAPAPTGIGRFAFRRSARNSRRRPTSPLLVAVFVLPSLVIYGLFMVYPFIGTIHLSLTSWDGFAPTKDFIGLDNYRVLLQDGEFWEALSHNLIWAVIGTIAPIVIGFPLAVMLWSGVRFRLAFRAMFFLPFILPSVVQGIIWGWIYNPLFGVLNAILEGIGLGGLTTGWLGNADTALYAVLGAAVWGTFGMIVVFFLAGLQGIDMNLIDAAKVDGANAWQRARHVLLPGIAPIFTFVLTVTLVGAFSVFDIIYVLTRGGPGTATEVLAGYSYEMAFTRNFAGYGASISMVIATLSLILAILFLRMRERNRANG